MRYTEDENGYILIPDNPISKTGVFDYLGASISPDLIPDKVYKVWRPEEELNNPETIDSFKLTPWIPEHVMLGAGFTAAEKVGVQGVTGETVEFRNGILYSNLKLFGDDLKKMIKAGLKQLSCGFRCAWDITAGITPQGIAYDVVQRQIRGNHLASVEVARMGSDIRVAMDRSHFALDSIDFNPKDNTGDNMADAKAKAKVDEKKAPTDMEKIVSAMDAMTLSIPALVKTALDAAEEKKAEDEQNKKDKADESHGEKDRNYKDNGKTALDAKEMKEQLATALDAIEDLKKQVAKKGSATDAADMIASYHKTQNLATKVATLVGAFDSSGMDSAAIAKYWAEKSGMACDSGMELPTLNGFLAAQQSRSFTAVPAVALDAAEVAASKSDNLDSLGL